MLKVAGIFASECACGIGCLLALAGNSSAPRIPANSGETAVQKISTNGAVSDQASVTPIVLASGTASMSCDYDYYKKTDKPITKLDEHVLQAAVERCAATNMIHLYYRGEINSGFAMLIEKLSHAVLKYSVTVRVLEIDSPGGDVDQAMKAGETIANTGWAVWVNEGASCASACVLVLASGGNRSISGTVAVHRLFPVASIATSRADLDTELDAILKRVRAYLQIHGSSPALADLMMTVPARGLRVLSEVEQKAFGLDGTNAAQADLERVQLVRKCGWDFVKRKEAWSQAASAECRPVSERSSDAKEKARTYFQCSLDVSVRFGFPDARCPEESPTRNLQRLIEASR